MYLHLAACRYEDPQQKAGQTYLAEKLLFIYLRDTFRFNKASRLLLSHELQMAAESFNICIRGDWRSFTLSHTHTQARTRARDCAVFTKTISSVAIKLISRKQGPARYHLSIVPIKR